MITVFISEHAKLKIRKSFSINKQSVQSFANKAFERGIKTNVTQGDLKKYMKTRNMDNIFCKLHANGIFVFKNIKIHEVLLITCWPLPGRLNNKYKYATIKNNSHEN